MSPRGAVVLTLIVAAALLLTGGAKYAVADRFQAAILAQLPIGLAASAALACAVPALELALGGALLLPAWRRPALAMTLALLGVLLAWKALLVARGFAGDCGCLGPLAAWPPWVTIWLDLALLGLATAAWARLRPIRSPSG